MNKIDWKSKLASRKFWAAIIGFVTTVLVAFNVDNLTIEHVTAIIGAVGVLVAYILAEGYIDGKREQANGSNIEYTIDVTDEIDDGDKGGG